MKFWFLFIGGCFVSFQAIAQSDFFNSSLKKRIDSVRNFIFPKPSSDLLPAEFNALSLENEYYGESDSLNIPTYYRGHVFVLTLRENRTFMYETFYKPYSLARIELAIGQYRILGDTIFFTYQSLLPGQADKIYISPTMTISWRLPHLPEYLLMNKDHLFEPSVQRLKKKAFYALTDKPQFDLSNTDK